MYTTLLAPHLFGAAWDSGLWVCSESRPSSGHSWAVPESVGLRDLLTVGAMTPRLLQLLRSQVLGAWRHRVKAIKKMHVFRTSRGSSLGRSGKFLHRKAFLWYLSSVLWVAAGLAWNNLTAQSDLGNELTYTFWFFSCCFQAVRNSILTFIRDVGIYVKVIIND